jgi:hypothetical protein
LIPHLAVVSLALYLLVLMARFAYPGSLYLSFFTDDFFYYLVIAKNIALHSVSTFNGIQLTNGYHPLWLALMAAVYKALGQSRGLFIAIVAIIWLLVVSSFFVLRRMQVLIHGANGIAPLCLMFSVVFMAVLARTGMEVSLALCLLLSLWLHLARQPLELQTTGGAVLTGILASAAILSRVDTALILGIYTLLSLCCPIGNAGRPWKNLLAFALGLVPVALYLTINCFFFGTLLPISGLAKNLKETIKPSLSTLSSLTTPNVVNTVFAWPSLLLCGCFAWLLIRRRGEYASVERQGYDRVQVCVLLHPILFYLILSFSSDWPLWTWYLYPLVPVAAILGPDVLKHIKAGVPLTVMNVMVGLLLIVFIANLARLNPGAVPIYQDALELQKIEVSHPGIYGMGDAAGTPAYSMRSPVVQLEGLVGDRAFLRRIQRRQPLLEALQELHVDYYVTIHATPIEGCYEVLEPAQAGPASPVMKARICSSPIAVFQPQGGTPMLVFDVRASQ